MVKKLFALTLMAIFFLTGCASADESAPAGFETLPVGNATHGAELYDTSIGGQPTCKACHSLDGKPNVGPTFQGYGQIATQRVSGESAEEYTYNSLIRPWAYVVPSYGNVMPVRYSQALTAQDIADLIAFLKNCK